MLCFFFYRYVLAVILDPLSMNYEKRKEEAVLYQPADVGFEIYLFYTPMIHLCVAESM